MKLFICGSTIPKTICFTTDSALHQNKMSRNRVLALTLDQSARMLFKTSSGARMQVFGLLIEETPRINVPLPYGLRTKSTKKSLLKTNQVYLEKTAAD